MPFPAPARCAWIAATALLLALPVTTLAAGAAAEPAAPLLTLSPAQQVSMGLRLAPIEPAQSPVLSLPGSVVVPPDSQRVVASAVAGLLTEVRVGVGDRVAAGQILARISSPQLVGLQRDLQSARVQLGLANDTLDRDERLLAEGLIPLARVQAARARRLEADALVTERRLQLRLAGLGDAESGDAALRAQAAIVAPAAGIIIEAGALSGQRVEAATALFRIAGAATLWLELQAPADRVAAIALGDRVEWPQRGVIARVSAIGAAVTAGQTVTVRATVAQGGERIRPGESLQALVRLAVPAAANWRVPQAAITQMGARTVVFVAHPQGARMVAVQVRGRDEDGAMIEAVLTGTDRVVVSGVSALKSMASEQRR